jgi:hypothetical protein
MFGQRNHGSVFRENLGKDAVDLFGPRNVNQSLHQLGAKPSSLEPIRNENSQFSFAHSPLPRQPSHSEQFVLTGIRILACATRESSLCIWKYRRYSVPSESVL